MGLLAIASLTACGDKVTVPQQTTTVVTPPTNVIGVTVTPASATLNVGDKLAFAASVNAAAGVTDRTVTWSSSDVTIVSVDANGLATALKAGTASIIAKSKADPTVQGAAVVTVASVTSAPATVTISTINTTACAPGGTCSSTPANLSSVAGQLDVTLNVDPGSAKLSSVQLLMNCGGADTVVAQQTLASAEIAAEAASAPVTLSFNTAAFNSTTGASAFKNGACVLKAKAITTNGTTVASSGQALTLNNADAVYGSISTTKGPATDAAGLSWVGGDVTVSALPVFYTAGRTAATVAVTLAGTRPADGAAVTVGTGQLTAASGAATTIVFPNTAGATNSVAGLTLNPLTATVTAIDNSGNQFTLAGGAFSNTLPVVRLDNQAPVAGAYAFNTQNATNNWVGGNFAFATSAGKGYTAGVGLNASDNDQKGVDKVTVTFQYTTSPATSSSTWTTVASGSAIPNSPNGLNTDYTLRMVETDALGNAKTTTIGTFGVDKNIPLAAFSGGAAANGTSNTTAAAVTGGGSFTIAYSDSISGFNTLPVMTTLVRNFEISKTAADCVIGTWDATNKVCNPVATTGTIPVDGGSGLNGYYTLTSTVIDQAGNAAGTLTRSVVVDNVAPTSSAGVAIPAAITGGTTVGFSAPFTDNLDLISSDGSVVYPNITITYPGALDTPGTAFDNVLTKSANATVTISNFISAMQQVDGTNAPTTASAKPTNVNVRASDEVGNFGTNSVALPAVNVVNGTGAADFTTANFATFTESNAAKTLSNGTGTGTRAVDLTASIVGSTSTQNNPFTQVCFYYQQTAAGQSNTGEWVLIGCQNAASVTDDPTQPAATGRTWLYTLSSFDPPASLGTAGTVNLVAVGMNSKGNGIATNVNSNVTLQP